jgi:hypothetical protein
MAHDRPADDRRIARDYRDRDRDCSLASSFNRIGSDSYPVLPKLVHPDRRLFERFGSHNIAKELSLRAPARKPRWLKSSPLYRSQGHVSRRGAQARIDWRNAPRDAVDVTCKRNGGEHAWSFLRIVGV